MADKGLLEYYDQLEQSGLLGYSVTPEGLGTLRGHRQSMNVEDRRNRRHPSDFMQRIRARAAMAEDELRNGLPEGATYSKQDVIDWLDRNDPIGETFGQSAGEAVMMPTPMPGYSVGVRPIYGVTDGMYSKVRK